MPMYFPYHIVMSFGRVVERACRRPPLTLSTVSFLAELTPAMATAEAPCLFFYGTLMHPSVIKRVTGQDGQNLHTRPAVLLVLDRRPPSCSELMIWKDYTRHHVKECDYRE